MTGVFFCPHLGGEVQLSGEREAHIAERHPDLFPEYRDRIGTTLADPDQVRRSRRFGAAKAFSRWYSDVKGGKHVSSWSLSPRARAVATGSSQLILPASLPKERSNG